MEKDGKKVRMYLVKWKQLPYEEATWEFREDFNDDQKLTDFEKWNRFPTVQEPRQFPLRKFIPMDQSPSFKGGTWLINFTHYSIGNQLRSYQLEGMNWLIFCWYERR